MEDDQNVRQGNLMGWPGQSKAPIGSPCAFQKPGPGQRLELFGQGGQGKLMGPGQGMGLEVLAPLLEVEEDRNRNFEVQRKKTAHMAHRKAPPLSEGPCLDAFGNLTASCWGGHPHRWRR